MDLADMSLFAKEMRPVLFTSVQPSTETASLAMACRSRHVSKAKAALQIVCADTWSRHKKCLAKGVKPFKLMELIMLTSAGTVPVMGVM
eukprot:scaffold145083_cov15-Tisochrysis_lutea.AAC.1